MTVTSVTATLTPYNPQISNSGIPAEQVSFTVGGHPSGSFVCDIRVLRAGKVVGTTQVGVGAPSGHPSSVQEGVAVSISGSTFPGTPADAQVACHLS